MNPPVQSGQLGSEGGSRGPGARGESGGRTIFGEIADDWTKPSIHGDPPPFRPGEFSGTCHESTLTAVS